MLATDSSPARLDRFSCLDCGEPITGRYCAHCGQRADPLHKSLGEFFSEFTEGLTNFDAKLWRTLPALVLRPGFLTVEFNAGRRTRYVHPFRVYLFVTFVFFGLLAVFGKPSTFVHVTHDHEHAAAVPDASAPKGDPASAATDPLAVGAKKLEKASEKEMLDQFVQHLPQVMFALLPVAALLLKLAYARSRFYVEHLVFVTHMHSFVFLLLGVFVVLPTLPLGISQWFPFPVAYGYFVVALKRVYGQGVMVTLAKSGVLALGYTLLVALAVAAATFLVMMTL